MFEKMSADELRSEIRCTPINLDVIADAIARLCDIVFDLEMQIVVLEALAQPPDTPDEGLLLPKDSGPPF